VLRYVRICDSLSGLVELMPHGVEGAHPRLVDRVARGRVRFRMKIFRDYVANFATARVSFVKEIPIGEPDELGFKVVNFHVRRITRGDVLFIGGDIVFRVVDHDAC